MSRIERLVNLTAALIDAERPLTREELRQRVGGYSEEPVAFRRNFERDKDLLRQMGMPVTTEIIDQDRPDSSLGYRIRRDDYELPDPGLEDDELAALRLATSAVQVDGADEATATALRKLAGAPGAAQGSGRAVPSGANPGPVVPAETAALVAGPEAATVFGAVAARRRIEFRYRGTPRTVDPWRLSYRNGQWYLSGFDHARADARLFRLDRIEGTVETVGEAGAFERPAAAGSGPARAWQIGDDDVVEVELVVDAEQASWARRALGAETVAGAGPEGSLRFVVPVTNQAAFRSFVLGMLEHAEITGPSAVRTSMVAWLEEMVGR